MTKTMERQILAFIERIQGEEAAFAIRAELLRRRLMAAQPGDYVLSEREWAGQGLG